MDGWGRKVMEKGGRTSGGEVEDGRCGELEQSIQPGRRENVAERRDRGQLCAKNFICPLDIA